MPSVQDVRTRLLTPENVGITVAIIFSIIGAYAIQLRVSAGVAAFFGLIVLGVSTPTTLTSHSLLGTRFPAAIVHSLSENSLLKRQLGELPVEVVLWVREVSLGHRITRVKGVDTVDRLLNLQSWKGPFISESIEKTP